MFKQFCMGQNLRALFSAQDIPPEIHPIISQYETTFTADIRGTFLNDDLGFNENFVKEEETAQWKASDLSILPNDIHGLLKQWITVRDPEYLNAVPRTAYMRNKIGRLGQHFRPLSMSLADCNVIFNWHGHDQHWSAGSIQSIFSHTRYAQGGARKTQTFAVVNEYSPLLQADIPKDHFRNFPVVGGRLFYRSPQRKVVLMSMDDIHCHFALSAIEVPGISEIVHVLPLDRVSL